LRYKSRIWIGASPEFQLKIIAALHESAIGGHSGVPVTYKRVKNMFAWTGLKATVQNYVKVCLVCQQAKPDRVKKQGLLQHLVVPEGAWQVVTMDFVEGLPASGFANCILVVVDKFTKYGHLSVKHPFTAVSIAKIFLDPVYKLHGMPNSIVTDRDRVFTSKFW
jgi:hypothetical protein